MRPQRKGSAAKKSLRLPLAILICGVFVAPCPALSRSRDVSGWYVAGKGGPSWSGLRGISSTAGKSVDDDQASNVIGSFGMAGGYQWMYRFGIPLRTEFEFMNRTEVIYDASPLLRGVSSGALASSVQNITAMGKMYWHIPVNSRRWWPFLSAGIGISRNVAKSQYTPSGGTPVKITHATTDLAWSAGLGASFKLGPNVINDVELRWVDLGRASWQLPGDANIEDDSFAAAELSFAIRIMF